MSRALRHGLAALAVVGAVLTPVTAAAQVNTEDLLDPDHEGFDGEVGLDLVVNSGNTDLWLVGSTLRLQYSVPRKPAAVDEGEDLPAAEAPAEADEASDAEGPPEAEEATGPAEPPEGESPPEEGESSADALGPRDAFVAFTRFERGESGDQKIAESGFAYASWIRMLSPRFGFNVLAQHEFDHFILLDQRSLLGAGVRFVHQPTPSSTLQLGTGYMIEYEEIDVPEDGPDDPQSTNHRWTNFMVAAASFGGDRIELVNTLYVQPRIDDLGDYRVLDEAELQIGLTERVSLGLSVNFRYDSRPPAGIGSTDFGLINRLRMRF